MGFPGPLQRGHGIPGVVLEIAALEAAKHPLLALGRPVPQKLPNRLGFELRGNTLSV
jgi:hypothetical protein